MVGFTSSTLSVEAERERVEQERAAEVERFRLEQKRAAEEKQLRLEQEKAEEADRLRLEQERAAEVERFRLEQKLAADEELLGLEQERAKEADRLFEETWLRGDQVNEVQPYDSDVLRSKHEAAAAVPPAEVRGLQQTAGGRVVSDSRVDRNAVSFGQERYAKMAAYLPFWALASEAPKRRARWIIPAIAAVIPLSAVVIIAILLNQQPAGGERPHATPSPSIVPPSNMVYLPGGVFVMGSDNGDEYEKPAHRVTVKPFFIDINEVTCEEYEKFVKTTGYQAPSGWVNGTFPAGAERKPVTGVNWDDANNYARWVKKRLPTEEEWEFAARGPEGWKYPWGNEWRKGLANADNASTGLADVGQFNGRSAFGLADMVGNAWEWTSTPIHSYHGGKIPEDQLSEVDRNKMKTIRGGCYLSSPQQATATYRRGWPQARGPYDFNQTGFRCAQDAPSKN
ncbi:MAG TPA: SUMF1/EgtB/PvdO family nonheme iron enzyme [Pyrinomonadaceae bacterium]|nr:SUMF1/EgtB/PvdO family nonheme iron enzyme [Pyrinomonadaceae bacterium]